MAALPTTVQVSSKVLSRSERAGDIAQFKISQQLPDLEYLDLSAQLELQRALQRWPLLAELREVQQHEEAGRRLQEQVKA